LNLQNETAANVITIFLLGNHLLSVSGLHVDLAVVEVIFDKVADWNRTLQNGAHVQPVDTGMECEVL
jgi:hypothetical protein